MYLTPTVIPYNSYSGPRNEIEINALTQDVDLSSLHSELRGITDAVEDLQYDHLSKISSLISAAQGIVKKSRPDQTHKHMDYWEVIEGSHELVRHHVKVRNTMFALSCVRSTLPIDQSRLTGKRITTMHFKDGTSQIVTDQDFRTLEDPTVQTRDWTGKTVFMMTPLTPAGTAIAASKASASFKRRVRKKTIPEQTEQSSAPLDKSSALLPPQSLDVPSSNRTESRMIVEETEKSILNRIRSTREFNHSMKDDLARLFHS